jgi:hypothetical protein
MANISKVVNKLNSLSKYEAYILCEICFFDDDVLKDKIKSYAPELKTNKNLKLLTILIDTINEKSNSVSKEEQKQVIEPFYSMHGSNDAILEKMINSWM